MIKKSIKIMIGCGVFCILITLAASWYAIMFNDSRLVVPLDFNSYTFQVKDLPMIIAVSLICIYVLALFILLFIGITKRNRQIMETNTTRKVNPKLGFLGLLGCLGFAGFWTYHINGTVSPFIFFLFFGFFGFFYEGKMSGTFMDERFRENAINAQLKSNKITFAIILAALVILCQGRLFGSLEYTFIATIITLSLTLAAGIFLPQYLLYHYDHDDQCEESKESED